jgi:hypothetical protein
MRDWTAQAKAAFDRYFPERQIMQRSCGAVRGLSLSPKRQALAALGAVGIAGWCVYASASTVFEDPRPAAVVNFLDERAKYERWLEDFRGRAAHARELLKDSTLEFEQERRNVEERHAVLRALLEYANGSSHLNPPEQNTQVALLDDIERAEPLALRTQAVSLVGLRDRIESFLGPAEASAADVTDTPESADFLSYVRDPDYAERVAQVAARVIALRQVN